MANVQELKVQLAQICSDLQQQGQTLQGLASKIGETEARTSYAMEDSSRLDVKQAAEQGIHAVAQDTMNVVTLIDHVCKLLETYAGSI